MNPTMRHLSTNSQSQTNLNAQSHLPLFPDSSPHAGVYSNPVRNNEQSGPPVPFDFSSVNLGTAPQWPGEPSSNTLHEVRQGNYPPALSENGTALLNNFNPNVSLLFIMSCSITIKNLTVLYPKCDSFAPLLGTRYSSEHSRQTVSETTQSTYPTRV